MFVCMFMRACVPTQSTAQTHSTNVSFTTVCVPIRSHKSPIKKTDRDEENMCCIILCCSCCKYYCLYICVAFIWRDEYQFLPVYWLHDQISDYNVLCICCVCALCMYSSKKETTTKKRFGETRRRKRNAAQ